MLWPLHRALLPLAAVACCGCASPLREVMLIITTDVDCTIIDRVQLTVARGTADNVTYNQIFVRTECMVTTDTTLPRALLANGAQMRLGVQDSHDTTQHLFVQVQGFLGTTLQLTSAAETDFVSNEVYGLPIALANTCIGTTCAPGSTCRVDPDSGNPLCALVYRAPGSVGLTLGMAADD